jgi:hypothetical protein
MNKAEIIRKGIELGVDFSETHSCHDPSVDGKACGQCDSCLLRKKGFREADVADPTVYAEKKGRPLSRRQGHLTIKLYKITMKLKRYRQPLGVFSFLG